jgi:hypothetical protein
MTNHITSFKSNDDVLKAIIKPRFSAQTQTLLSILRSVSADVNREKNSTSCISTLFFLSDCLISPSQIHRERDSYEYLINITHKHAVILRLGNSSEQQTDQVPPGRGHDRGRLPSRVRATSSIIFVFFHTIGGGVHFRPNFIRDR